MNQQKPKARVKETIKTGVGRYPTLVRRAIHPENAVDFVSGYCVCPELGQDIRIAIDKAITNHMRQPKYKGSLFGFVPEVVDRAYGVHCELIESHKLLRLNVSTHTRPRGSDREWLGSNVVSIINLRLTADGLIADFYDNEELPRYNPANSVTVIDRSESEYH